MSGHIVERGPNRWAIVLEIYDSNGRRKQKWHSFSGTKREAKIKLAELEFQRHQGTYIDTSKRTLSEFLDTWEADWAAQNVTPKTLERYSQLLRKHVRPAIGTKRIQQIRAEDLNKLYRGLHGTLAPRTIKHIHRLLHRVLGHAAKWGTIKNNPCTLVDAPKVPYTEAPVLRSEEIPTLLAGLRDKALYPIAIVALGTGMRRGELCALRWVDVDLDAGSLKVERSLEQTRKAGLRFKEPKTARGRRTISLSPIIVACLKEHRRAQLEARLALGLGKLPGDALVFPTYEGKPRMPDGLSKEFSEAMTAIDLPHVTLHTLRHTHASELIRKGVDILTICRRLGHSSAAITLGVTGI